MNIRKLIVISSVLATCLPCPAKAGDEPPVKWKVKVSGDLSGGFGFYNKTPRDHYLRSDVDSNGNPILGGTNKDKQQYTVQEYEKSETIGYGFTGILHVMFVPVADDGTQKIVSTALDPKIGGRKSKLLSGLFTAYGFTIGSNISSSTSGPLSNAPFLGLSAFAGETQEFAITFGCAWIPSTRFRDLSTGNITLNPNPVQYTKHNACAFVGLYFKFGQGTNVAKQD